jgi:hypothetical protein
LDLVTASVAVVTDSAAALTNGINSAIAFRHHHFLNGITNGVSAVLSVIGAGYATRALGAVGALADAQAALRAGRYAAMDAQAAAFAAGDIRGGLAATAGFEAGYLPGL